MQPASKLIPIASTDAATLLKLAAALAPNLQLAIVQSGGTVLATLSEWSNTVIAEIATKSRGMDWTSSQVIEDFRVYPLFTDNKLVGMLVCAGNDPNTAQ